MLVWFFGYCLFISFFLDAESTISKARHSLVSSPKCTISKVFHHRISSTNKPYIEVGSVVLYLDKDVLLKPSKSSNREREYYHYHIPANLTASAHQMMLKAQEVGDLYTVDFKEQRGGIQLTIGFDPKKVGIAVDKFNTITQHKGITFRLYNKDLLNQMEGHKPIIHVAQNQTHSVFIDCGHGGSDCGAIGWGNLQEKDINLQIGTELATQLKKKGLKVLLSRDEDRALGLDERTSLANKNNVDLFISIHANSARPEVSGVETYFVDSKLFQTADTSLINVESDKTNIYLKNKSKKSANLAYTVHSRLVNSLSNFGTLNRHVRNQVAQVLHGVAMPAILVEVGYMTHEREATLLSNQFYQKKIADGITNGVLSYLGRC